MSRAALLPNPGDPILLKFWLDFYKRFWMDEVDRLYVYVNSPISQNVVDYMTTLVQSTPKALLVYADHLIEHGDALKHLVSLATEDHLMFIEDDGFIHKPGIVDECFKRIESGEVDALGSRRGSCSQWLYDRMSEKWGLDNSGFGDHGPNFWPNFFFAKRRDLLQVTNFAAKTWQPGEQVPELGMVAPELLTGDTFVEGSLQLRWLGLRFAYVPQYHLMPDDMDDYLKGSWAFSPQAKWLHVGSLSSGINGMLRDREGRSLARRHLDPPEPYKWGNAPEGDLAKMEFERRIAWFSLALDHFDATLLPELAELYGWALVQVVAHYGLSSSRIEKRKNIYKGFMP